MSFAHYIHDRLGLSHGAQLGVFRPSSGHWHIMTANNNWDHGQHHSIQCGANGDIPVPGDYLGTGKVQLAVFRPSSGHWYIKGAGTHDWSGSSGNIQVQCGQNGDIPVPADYFGEGRLRMAVFRPSDGMWHIKGAGLSDWGSSQGNMSIQCGMSGDVPVPADYHGEGRARIAVWRPSNGTWYVNGSNQHNWGHGGETSVQCGMSGDIPVPADFHGEGRVRMCVWRPSNGTWYINGSNHHNWGHGGETSVQCGMSGDIPVPASYHKDGRDRIAVWRPSDGKWYINGSNQHNWGHGGEQSFQCGMSGDIPKGRSWAHLH